MHLDKFVAKMLCNNLEATSHKYCTHSLALRKCWDAACLLPGSFDRIRNPKTSKQICNLLQAFYWSSMDRTTAAAFT